MRFGIQKLFRNAGSGFVGIKLIRIRFPKKIRVLDGIAKNFKTAAGKSQVSDI
jgi:hypothetical protein